MSQLLFGIPLVAGSVLASGVVAVSGGSALHASLVGLATGATGFATSTLAVQSQSARQKLVEEECDRLKLELSQQMQLLSVGDQLASLQELQGVLLRNIDEIQQYKTLLFKEKNLGQTVQLFPDSELRAASALEQFSEQEVEKEEKPFKNENKVVVEFLERRGIKVKSVPLESPSDEVINSLSNFLGQNYASLHDLLAKIKRSMQQGTSFSLSLKEYSKKDIGNTCQFCNKLHTIAFLEEYKYAKSPQYLIRAKASTLPAAQNFFSGQWLERFSLLIVRRCVALTSVSLNRKLDFAYLLNPQVTLPNGDDFELDLICYVNGAFVWIESKSGDYQHHIGKYSKISKLLELDSKHSIMILPDMSEDKRSALESLFSMTICSLDSLEQTLIKTIRQDQLKR